MTKPTQKQIEAIAIGLYAQDGGHPGEWGLVDQRVRDSYRLKATRATAAAEVGDDEPPDLNSVLLGFTNYVNNERVRSYNEGVDDTIERCAQVAESVNGAEFPVSGDLVQIAAKRIAAAIRALDNEK